MNYWEMQKSFWKTPIGITIWISLLGATLFGGLLALNLFVSPYPIIEFFEASPLVVSLGEPSNLSWSVIGASSVNIEPNIGPVESKGFREIYPSETTIYTLLVINESRNRSRELKVIVSR